MRWEKVQSYPKEVGGVGEAYAGPGKRWGHTCNAIKGGRFLFVFGGYGKDNCQTNQVHAFDTTKQTWSQLAMKGTLPMPRDSHSCTTVGDNLFVFGGTDGMNPLKDLYILDTVTHTWICPSVRGEGPEAREGHSAALVGKRLFIFGGCGKSSDNNDEIYYNDLYILNTETFVWKRAATSGNPPSARDSHTCSSWKNKIIVIGGEDGHDYYLSDVHILDADTLAWKELNTSGQVLTPRAGHSTVAFGKNLFVFGGFTDAQNLYDDLYMLDLDIGIWTKVITRGDGPSARFSVAGDCLDPLKSGVLVFIGGCSKTLEALDDLYYLHTGLVVWDERKLEKLSLRKQLKLKCQEQNLSNFGHDKALLRIDVGNHVNQPIPLSSSGQPRRENFPLNEVLLQGKKTFQAKVTESFPHGYTIETIIDGKPLRGILFANVPVQVPNLNSSRKRAFVEVGDTVLNGYCNSKLGSVRQDSGDHKQADVHEKDYLLLDTEASAPSSTNLAQSDLSTHKDPAKQDISPSAAHLNLNDDKAGDALNSGTEGLDGIGAMSAGFSINSSPKQDERRPDTLELYNTNKLI
ncbi:Transporter associated with antigen processing protein 2 isoform 1 [Hibiscus syriacus]|uniref:Transporter associated with antigen processing protein 2 isoform 1 n=1 Tax=Hibiscus syriacus TaxID=106335 RepID=A0A6A2YQ48_HIBSY|nr:kelch domain-containing protein 3-like [Hibiscus syriacus]KAE8681417.1 Transporter associated with antigen processing protein 2 isoform 1 [Hibiscus syriacus]